MRHRMQHYLVLSRGNFVSKNGIVTNFYCLALGGPVIMPRHVVIHEASCEW